MKDSDIKEFEYKEPIYFHIPAIFDKKYIMPLNNSYYAYLNSIKKDNVNFVVYGCPMSCTWNGGRLIYEPVYRIETLYEMFYTYIIGLNIDIQLSFTNYLIEETDVYDRCGNAILSVANAFPEHVEIMVASEILENYIREKYPNLKITRSIVNLTKPTEDDFKKYSTIVLPKWQNHDIDYINSIKNKTELELLCDEPCITNCPRKRTHYLAYNKCQMFIKTDDVTYCDKNTENQFYNELMILPEEINDYIDLGIHHFKLRGRDNNLEMIMTLSEYCIDKKKRRDFLSQSFIILSDRLKLEY